VAVVSQWFAKRKGMAFGLMMSGAAAGSTVWPIIWANLPQRIGFAWTMRLVALIVGVLGTMAFFLLKTRLPPKPRGPFFYLQAFKGLAYCMVAVGSMAYVWSFFVWMFFIGTYGNLIGLGDFAPYLLVITNGSSLVGRIVTAAVGDRVGAYNNVIISNTIMFLCFWIWLGVKSKAALIAINVLFGLASGGFVSLQAPMITRVATDMRFGGTMVGQVLLIQSFAQLIGPPISGALLGGGTVEEQLSRFPHAIILGGVMMLISATCVAVGRWSLERRLFVIV